MFKCALVKPVGLLSQHAGEMALSGFRRVHVCVCVFMSVIVKRAVHGLTFAYLSCVRGCAFMCVAYV